MKVLVTGSEGYIGAVLVSELLSTGFDVVGLDTGFYREGYLYHDQCSVLPPTLNKDIRDVTVDDLRGFHAVVHLAELSNDPVGETNPSTTYEINHQASVSLAAAAKRAGITRFVYTSSCSVYGISDEEWVDERSDVSPQTAYAKCKVLVEDSVSKLADDSFAPTFLRNATAYGASPRMRFDVVLNNLAALAWTTGVVALTSDGTPWRPLVHVRDICSAIKCVLDAPLDVIRSEIVNVGSDSANYRMRELATIVGDVFPGCRTTFGESDPDVRSYRVRFDKIQRLLPSFRCQWTPERGAEELRDIFQGVSMTPEIFQFRAYTRVKAIKYLLATRQIGQDYYWLGR